MHIDSGLVVSEGVLPQEATDVQLMHVQQLSSSAESELIAAEYDDSEIVAFVERRLAEIIGQQGVAPLRLITTNEKNAVYIDYRSGNEEARILLKVQDVIHADWSIRARYEPVNREWKKVQGGGLNNDPTPERLYEWEEGVKQWILKERLTPPAGG